MTIQTVIKRDNERQPFTLEKLVAKASWSIHGYEHLIDWPSVVLKCLEGRHDDVVTTKQLDQWLMEELLSAGSWAQAVAAGRIYTSGLRKTMWWNHKPDIGGRMPTVAEMHRHLVGLNFMEDMGYTKEEYAEVEKIIDHSADFEMAQFQIKHNVSKYSVSNFHTGERFETPQYLYMRLAMALNQFESDRVKKITEDYKSLQRYVVPPTPGAMYMGTPHKGLSSCCIYAADDDKISMLAGKVIAYTMTYSSAGIGNNIDCRSLNDPVRGGAIVHQGKEPYFFSMGGDVTENRQGGRGGAATTYTSIFDPEFTELVKLQNPRTTVDRQNRRIHFAAIDHITMAKMVARDEEYIPFNKFTAPRVNELFYAGDHDAFEKEYRRWMSENQGRPKLRARDTARTLMQQIYEVGTNYWMSVNEANRHTPLNEPIRSSNLCTEIYEHTAPYYDVRDLYLEEDHGRGEVAMCNLAATVLPRMHYLSEEDYGKHIRTALRLAAFTLEHSHYELPHIGFTAKKRRYAGIGYIGLATLMAMEKKRYGTLEGRNFIHQVSERHMWHLINESIKLGQEKGNAPWIDRTKWVEGWTPLHTYNRNVDELVTTSYRYDWDKQSENLINNGGMYFSLLCSLQPTESSSKGAGFPNGPYQIRELAMKKSDGSNIIDWVAYDNDTLRDDYQIAWDSHPIDQIKDYAVMQKFCDQGGSFDRYRDRRTRIDFSEQDLISEYLTMHKYGMKGAYYGNSITTNQSQRSEGAGNCAGGACKM